MIRAHESAYAVEFGARIADETFGGRVLAPQEPQHLAHVAPRCDLRGDRAHLVLRAA